MIALTTTLSYYDDNRHWYGHTLLILRTWNRTNIRLLFFLLGCRNTFAYTAVTTAVGSRARRQYEASLLY